MMCNTATGKSFGLLPQFLAHSSPDPWDFIGVERNKGIFCYANLGDFRACWKGGDKLPGEPTKWLEVSEISVQDLQGPKDRWVQLPMAMTQSISVQPFSSPGTQKLITKILWHTKNIFLPIWHNKNRYNCYSFAPDSYCVGCSHFYFDNLKEKRLVPLTK